MSPVCEQHELIWKTMEKEISEIRADLKEIKTDVKALVTIPVRVEALESCKSVVEEHARQLATHAETLDTLKKICYGAVAVGLTALLGAIVGMVMK